MGTPRISRTKISESYWRELEGEEREKREKMRAGIYSLSRMGILPAVK